MRTICQGRAWEENDEVKCDYDGVLLTYRREDVEHIHKTFVPQETEEAQPSDSQIKPVAPAPSAPKQPSKIASGETAFYDPRRPYKYWSSKSGKHHTYQDAIAALAKEFKRPLHWVEERIGETNDLEQIRQSISQPDTIADHPADSVSDSLAVSGILFYNPRREYKYQINATQKFHTFEEAITALADEFDASAKWVEAHMGENNDIAAIRDRLSRTKAQISDDGHQNLKDY